MSTVKNTTIKIAVLLAKEIGWQALEFLLSIQKEWNLEFVALLTNQQADNPSNVKIINLGKKQAIPILQSLDDLPSCDYIISVQYHEILKEKHIQKAKLRAVNLHLAPLPEYRGCNQFSFAIYNQENYFGVSLHEINAQVDDGDLIAEKRWDIPQDIWVYDLWQQANEYGIELFKEGMIALFENPSLKLEKQKVKSHFYLRKDIVNIKELKWGESQELWERKIRATSMPGFEGPYFMVEGKKVFVSIKE